MTIKSSGSPLSLQAIAAEYGNPAPFSISRFYAGPLNRVPTPTYGYPGGISTPVPEIGAISISNFYGATVWRSWYSYFSTTYVAARTEQVYVLLVAGGGGGGGIYVGNSLEGGGGGGAGGVVTFRVNVIQNQSYNIYVGSGGSGTLATGINGNDSTAFGVTAIGGGGGGGFVPLYDGDGQVYAYDDSGRPGGSGGGACAYYSSAVGSPQGGAGTPGQGSNGYAGAENNWSGGGGGAAGGGYYGGGAGRSYTFIPNTTFSVGGGGGGANGGPGGSGGGGNAGGQGQSGSNSGFGTGGGGGGGGAGAGSGAGGSGFCAIYTTAADPTIT